MTVPADGNDRFDLWAPEAGTVILLADGRQYPMTRRPDGFGGDGADGGGWWTAPGAPAPASGDVDYGYLLDGDTTPFLIRGPAGSQPASTPSRGRSTPGATSGPTASGKAAGCRAP